LDFDEGGRAIANSTCFKDGDSFEPRDEVKGDVARMIFYMAVRYEGFNGEIDLEINELVDNNAPNIGILSVLLQWHLDDPVDDLERTRNDLIFGYQGNRNPFIDHPEFANLIWGN
jgi:endonuclease I